MIISNQMRIETQFAARKISCMRGSRKVLKGVDMDASAGQVVGLMGANGAGKTTFFDVLCGLRTASSGNFESQIPTDRIAYLTQTITVPDALRLGELAELVFGVAARDNTKQNVSKYLGPKELEKFSMLWDRRSNSCSYGEKRWFVLVVVLALDADLFILDEPTAGVDIEYRHYIWQAIRKIKQQGKIVIFSTHVAAEIEDICDHFFFLKEGKARRFASTEEFLRTTRATTLETGFVNYLTDDAFAE